jgi:hypothetical protein
VVASSDFRELTSGESAASVGDGPSDGRRDNEGGGVGGASGS